ncbi:hypoxanthine phosphoribosyltransferase [Eubacterium aggregans]|uniref:hypoxanthine phosphoribosyltransferase n=1 Tax=Eubacterium aggregans TaxID=81409 RepID=UPI003F304626
MNKDVERILLTEETLSKRVREMGQQISRDFCGRSVLAVCILKGSVVFFSDLIRQIEGDVQIAFISAASYGAGAESSGDVKVTEIMEIPIDGRDVIIVEDIVDSGHTLARIRDAFDQKVASSVTICTLLDKPERREIPVGVDYSGFTIPNEFVVGYGLDYNQCYRNLPYVCILKREMYE